MMPRMMPKMREERANMRIKTTFLVALVAGILQASISKAIVQDTTIIKPVNSTTLRPASVESSTPAAESLETAPSITSVHQVWTSSSSGSLDELSPEVISKLRQDVPFLAAYALRPRLVGAVPTTVMPQTGQQPLNELSTSTASQRLETASSNGAPSVVTGLKGKALRTHARQVASSSLFPKLGDFSEFNVETSSTSKSEHHHKRKTSLKKRKNEGILDDQNRRIGIGSSQLVKKKRAKSVSARGGSNFNKKSWSRRNDRKRSRVNSPKRLKKQRSNKLKIVAKNGHYFQGRSIEAKPHSNELDVEMRALGRDATTFMMDDENVSANNGGGGGVKGGSAKDDDKPPFYASKRPVSKSDKSDDNSDEALLSNGLERGLSSASGGSSSTEPSKRAEGSVDEEVGDLDDDEPEPKRVGDPDVEDDGDTILVEPKSDGVDDDPPLPDEDPTGASDSDESEDGGSPRVAAQGDPRGKRVDRERPNPPSSEAGRDADDDNGADDGQVAGGGIGTTIGGSGHDGVAPGAGKESEDGSVDGSSRVAPSGARDLPSSTPTTAGDDKRFTQSGVEFADERPDRDVGGSSDGRASGAEAGGSSAKDEGEFGDRRKLTPMRPRGSGERGPELDDDDLDYRDEIESNRDGARSPDGNGCDLEHRDGERGLKKDSELGQTNGNKVGTTSPTSATGSHAQHCDDGSYNHHDDHHDAGHHNHHDTIDWLRGSIPGEPEEDYPILSRVNGSNFKCSEQKYPGYYADVESRCQIFHICQADERQDSFL